MLRQHTPVIKKSALAICSTTFSICSLQRWGLSPFILCLVLICFTDSERYSENYEIRPLNKPITAIMSQHTWKCTTNSDIIWQNWTHSWVAARTKGIHYIYAKQNTSAQLPVHTRLDPLKLARDPLNVVAGSPTDLLKILASGSPVTGASWAWT